MDVRQARRVIRRQKSGWISELRRKSERTVPAEIIGDTLTEAVVDHPETGADGSLSLSE